jgi:hypothetical protein
MDFFLYFKHYSGRGTDKEWVEYVWNRLNIKYLNFEDELKKYKRNQTTII